MYGVRASKRAKVRQDNLASDPRVYPRIGRQINAAAALFEVNRRTRHDTVCGHCGTVDLHDVRRKQYGDS